MKKYIFLFWGLMFVVGGVLGIEKMNNLLEFIYVGLLWGIGVLMILISCVLEDN